MDRQIKVDSVLYRMENNIFFWKSSGSNKCLVLRVVVMDHQDLTTGIATGIISDPNQNSRFALHS